MIVCICHRVSDRDITREAARGCADFAALQDSLRVATACGACLECARETFNSAAGASAPTCHGTRRAAEHHATALA
jgi:bacterioferritin-associated ferredoxin